MGLKDHLPGHHHDNTVNTAEHVNNVPHVGGVAPEQVHMPGMAAGYTKPVYVPVESLPHNTIIPNNHEGGKHHHHLHFGHKHTVPAGAAAAPAQTTENAPVGVPVPRRDGKHGSHDDLLPKTGVVGVTDAANPVLIPGMPVAAPVPVPAPVPVEPVPVPVREEPTPAPVEPVVVPAPIPVARDVADLPPAGHAHHDVPLTTTGPVTELHPEPVRDIDQVPAAVPVAHEAPRSAAIPETGAPVVDAVAPVAAPVAAEREVAPVKEEPTIIKPGPTGGPRDVGPHPPTTGIKPAGTTVPSMINDVASMGGSVNEHAVPTHHQPANPDFRAV